MSPKDLVDAKTHFVQHVDCDMIIFRYKEHYVVLYEHGKVELESEDDWDPHLSVSPFPIRGKNLETILSKAEGKKLVTPKESYIYVSDDVIFKENGSKISLPEFLGKLFKSLSIETRILTKEEEEMISSYQKSVENLMDEFHPDVDRSKWNWFYLLYVYDADKFIEVLETLEKYGKQYMIKEEIKRHALLDDYYEYLLLNPWDVNEEILKCFYKYDKDKYAEYRSKIIKHSDDIEHLQETFGHVTYS